MRSTYGDPRRVVGSRFAVLLCSRGVKVVVVFGGVHDEIQTLLRVSLRLVILLLGTILQLLWHCPKSKEAEERAALVTSDRRSDLRRKTSVLLSSWLKIHC